MNLIKSGAACLTSIDSWRSRETFGLHKSIRHAAFQFVKWNN